MAIKGTMLENIELSINKKFVFEQEGSSEDQDFILPQEAYLLLRLKIASDVQLKKTRMCFFFKVDNLLNITYQDYLNRQRYFADDLGINTSAGLSINF